MELNLHDGCRSIKCSVHASIDADVELEMNTSTANAFAIHTKQSEVDEQLSREAAAPGRGES